MKHCQAASVGTFRHTRQILLSLHRFLLGNIYVPSGVNVRCPLRLNFMESHTIEPNIIVASVVKHNITFTLLRICLRHGVSSQEYRPQIYLTLGFKALMHDQSSILPEDQQKDSHDPWDTVETKREIQYG